MFPIIIMQPIHVPTVTMNTINNYLQKMKLTFSLIRWIDTKASVRENSYLVVMSTVVVVTDTGTVSRHALKFSLNTEATVEIFCWGECKHVSTLRDGKVYIVILLNQHVN